MIVGKEKSKGRDPVKREEIISHIRKQIAAGVWEPGGKLPPRTWFEKEFDAAPLTVQRSFQVLIDDHILESEQRVGTRVSMRSPHLNRYALVLYGTKKQESVFTRVLLNAARIVAEERNLEIDPVFILGVCKELDDLSRFQYRFANRLYAGVFYATIPNGLKEMSLELSSIPQVAIGPSSERFPHLNRVDFNTRSVYPQVMRYWKEHGCRRVAAILSGDENSCLEKSSAFRNLAEESGFECPPEYALEIGAINPRQTGPVTKLLFSRFNQSHPEGLYVGDDNFLPYVLDSLIRNLGEERAKRISIVSQVNFPRLEEYELPVKFFGFDMVELFRKSVRIMEQTRSGEFASPSIWDLKCSEEFEIKKDKTIKERRVK